MLRRRFVLAAFSLSGGLLGCRSNQFATVRSPDKPDMVGSHAAGAETYKPLVEQAVGELLARHSQPAGVVQASTSAVPPMARICFVAVENKSAEEIGDFKDQIYQVIDTRILESHIFQPINKRYVDAGLMQTRLRPEELFVPDNMRTFTAVMEQQGQPFDCLLYATVTSGTTRENKDYQRDYLLTLELIDIRTGQQDKQSASISKGYYHSRAAKWFSFTGLKR
jgi:hypothetical protein